MPNELRILSLLPSATETVCALGLGAYLVGRSHECDYPEKVLELPVCSRPRYQRPGNSAEINRSTQTILQEALSKFNVDTGKIKELKPTHILTQSQCRVCAVGTDELREALINYIHEEQATIIDANPQSLKHIYSNILEIAGKTGVSDRGTDLVQSMKSAFAQIESNMSRLSHKPSVAHIEWMEPLMTGGHWMMELIDWAGGRNCFPEESKRWITPEDLAGQNPEKIVIAPCGFSIEQSVQDLHCLEQHDSWDRLDAVCNNEIYICDGSRFFNRPGPRLVNSLEILTEIYHPEMVPRKHDHSAWIQYRL